MCVCVCVFVSTLLDGSGVCREVRAEVWADSGGSKEATEYNGGIVSDSLMRSFYGANGWETSVKFYE